MQSADLPAWLGERVRLGAGASELAYSYAALIGQLGWIGGQIAQIICFRALNVSSDSRSDSDNPAHPTHTQSDGGNAVS